jgi:hypothetical protein
MKRSRERGCYGNEDIIGMEDVTGKKEVMGLENVVVSYLYFISCY